MVVLAAAVCTKQGRALVSRQFVEMTRIRIEGLLAAFPKLMGSGNKQHTFVETETVRYVYQPVESLFLLILTTKSSNIVEDLETLRLLSKVVPEVCDGGYSEDAIAEHCFELIFAFDEVINMGGHRETVNLQQIRTNLEMESHEEKLHLMIRQSKMDTAKEEMKRKAVAIRESQKAMANKGHMEGFGSGSGGGDSGSGAASSLETPEVVENSASVMQASAPAPAPARTMPIKKASGMSLGGKKKKTNLMSSLAAEDGITIEDPATMAAAEATATATPPAAAAAAASNDPVSLTIEEKLSCTMSRVGEVEKAEVKGALTLVVSDEGASKCKVSVGLGDGTDAFKFQTHPKIGKPQWESARTLGLKDASKGFPLGKPVGILRWSRSLTEDECPLSINCWPDDQGGSFDVVVEYTLNNEAVELRNVNIVIPLGGAGDNVPSVESCDGDYRHNAENEALVWHLDLIDSSNSTGTLEFSIGADDAEGFFPVQVGFASPNILCNLEVDNATLCADGSAVRTSQSKQLLADSYNIV